MSNTIMNPLVPRVSKVSEKFAQRIYQKLVADITQCNAPQYAGNSGELNPKRVRGKRFYNSRGKGNLIL